MVKQDDPLLGCISDLKRMAQFNKAKRNVGSTRHKSKGPANAFLPSNNNFFLESSGSPPSKRPYPNPPNLNNEAFVFPGEGRSREESAKFINSRGKVLQH